MLNFFKKTRIYISRTWYFNTTKKDSLPLDIILSQFHPLSISQPTSIRSILMLFPAFHDHSSGHVSEGFLIVVLAAFTAFTF